MHGFKMFTSAIRVILRGSDVLIGVSWRNQSNAANNYELWIELGKGQKEATQYHILVHMIKSLSLLEFKNAAAGFCLKTKDTHWHQKECTNLWSCVRLKQFPHSLLYMNTFRCVTSIPKLYAACGCNYEYMSTPNTMLYPELHTFSKQ